MPDTPTTREDEAPAPAAPRRRWSALTAWFTAPLIPATTARRTHHVSLKRAYAIHLGTGLLAVVVVVLLVAWADTPVPVPSPWSVWDGFLYLMAESLDDFREEPYVISLAVMAVFAAIEIGYVALAFIVTPWGARDESIKASLRNGVRRTWLHTSHVLLLIVGIGAFTVVMERLDSAWNLNHPLDWPDVPQVPAGATPGSPQWDLYQAALQEYEERVHVVWTQWYNSQPFLVRHAAEILALVSGVTVTWWLAALLRGVGADRRIPPVLRPPLCEACGYNLTHAPLGARCSECGVPVAASLGPDARPGTWWDRRDQVGPFRAAWRCSVDAVLRPDRLGRTMRVCSAATAHRRVLIASLPALYVAAFLGPTAIISAATGELPPGGQWSWFLVPMFAAAGYFTGLAVLWSSAAALLVGIGYWFRDKRNLLPAAMQAACYLSGFLSLWILFLTTSGAAVILANEQSKTLGRIINIHSDIIQFVVWFTPNLVCLVLYFALLVKITAATRYANK